MNITILQNDPIDPGQEDQVSRIRHQRDDLMIEYIQKSSTEMKNLADFVFFCSSTPLTETQLSSLNESVLIISPYAYPGHLSWQIVKGMMQPWNGEWLVRMISALVLSEVSWKRSLQVEFHRIRKEHTLGQIEKVLEKNLKKKERPEAVWLFAQERQQSVPGEDRMDQRLDISPFWIRQKSDYYAVALLYDPGRLLSAGKPEEAETEKFIEQE